VVTKSDGDNVFKAKAARTEYAQAMHFLQGHEAGWVPQALTCSAVTGEGIWSVYEMIELYRHKMIASGYLKQKRKEQLLEILKTQLDEQILRQAYRSMNLHARLQALSRKNTINPFREIEGLLDKGAKH
jgi:LAO/AO transport system kinase